MTITDVLTRRGYSPSKVFFGAWEREDGDRLHLASFEGPKSLQLFCEDDECEVLYKTPVMTNISPEILDYLLQQIS